jgi:hypothetical protein
MKKPPSAPPVDPILYTPPTVTIAGIEYPLRRLNVRDVFRIVPIVSKGANAILAGNGQLQPAQILQALMQALVTSEREVTALLADLIGVTPDDFNDGHRFPITATIDIIEAVAEHEDLRAFIARVQAAAGRLPGLSNPTPTA